MTTRTKKLPSKKKTVLCLRTVKADGTAYNGFKWPALGFVEASDWEPTIECGHGLHGYLRGCGDAKSIDWGGLFQVIKVIESEIVDLGGKVKFPRCEVIFTGNQKDATDILVKEYGRGSKVIGATVVVNGERQHAIAGDRGTAISAGYGGMATAGYYGTATSAGYRGTATAGYRGTATAGDRGTATSAGHDGTATSGYDGTAMAGDGGKATAGNYGTATAGYYGKATVGHNGTATAGDHGTATAGHYGTATAGVMGRISILYWDGQRYREVIGYIGENGLEPNVSYKLNNRHKFVKA
jgi:hypothetical protein